MSITDAAGHGLRAAMLSSLTLSALRNARRCGFPILDQARTEAPGMSGDRIRMAVPVRATRVVRGP